LFSLARIITSSQTEGLGFAHTILHGQLDKEFEEYVDKPVQERVNLLVTADTANPFLYRCPS
jgi:hypothetical protein